MSPVEPTFRRRIVLLARLVHRFHAFLDRQQRQDLGVFEVAGLAGGCATPPGGPWGICGHFQTVPYLKRGGVRVGGPEDRGLEGILAALRWSASCA
jgi:hypothetical protein